MSAREMLTLVAKQWASVTDIMKIGEVGYSTATRIKKAIEKDILKPGQKLPFGKVPMFKVIEYLHININYLKKVANEVPNDRI